MIPTCPDCDTHAQPIPHRGAVVWRCPWTLAATWTRRVGPGVVGCGRPYVRRGEGW